MGSLYGRVDKHDQQSRLEISMIARALRLLSLLALTAIACSDSKSPEIVPPKITIEQLYLFDVYFVNAAWGYMLKGTYVDNQGNVVSYDHSFALWIPENRYVLTIEELNEKYTAPSDTIAHVDEETLHDMFNLIEEASHGELSKPETTGFDMGQLLHVCYRYDNGSGRYTEVLLSTKGDITQRNLSDAAIELRDWLNAVLADARKKEK